MKRLFSLLLAVALTLSLALTSFAVLPYGVEAELGITPGGSISGTVITKTGSVKVSGTSYPAQASGMHRQINLIRAAADLPALKSDPNLEEAAKQRALEISVTFSHTRPDGSKWRTVSDQVNGENVGRGIDNYLGIIGHYGESVSNSPESFMQSQGHRAAILDPDFVRVQTYCFETGGEMYWVQLFGSDVKLTAEQAKNQPSSSVLTDDGTSGKSSVTPTTVPATGVDSAVVGVVRNVAVKNGSKTVTLVDPPEITPATLKAATEAAGGVPLTIQADSTNDTATVVNGRIYLQPAQLSKVTQAIKLGIEVDSTRTKSLHSKFSGWYSNKMAVVSFAHQGNFGAPLVVAVKADLSSLNTKNLRFYSYNESTNLITELVAPNYSINGSYLQFITPVGGDLILTDSALS